MTMQSLPAVQAIELPKPNFPMVTRMISDPLFPESKPQTVGCPHCKGNISVSAPSDKQEPITWIVGQAHPLVPDMKLVRMFVDSGGVEVYSVSSDGKAGMRNLVPMDSIRLVEEAMPLDVFVEEITAAEEDDEPDDPEPDPGDQPDAPAPVANGQAVS